MVTGSMRSMRIRVSRRANLSSFQDLSMRHPLANESYSDSPSRSRLERLLQGAHSAAVLAHRLKMLDIEAAHRLAWYRSHFNPDQPRVPAGHPDGGQWTSDGSPGAPSPVRLAALDPTRAFAGLIKSDAAPGGIKVWTKYAEAKDADSVPGKSDVDPDTAADVKLVEQTTDILHKVVLAVATAVIRRPGSTPREFGTDVHIAFANAVRFMNLPGIGQKGVEQSFDKDGETRYGKDGSIRTDVVLRNPQGVIIAIYDLKTGNAIIRPSRARELRAKTGSGPEVPVIELHAVRGPAYK
jgi:hypothetical protein